DRGVKGSAIEGHDEEQVEAVERGRVGIGQRGAFGAFLQSAPCRGAPSEREKERERETDGRTNERTDGWTRQEGGGGGGIREGRKAKGARAREESSATRHATLDRRT
ncbi:hypothetical protein ALC57_14337, partial [Trachymyrmex cornetzi]